MILKNIEELKTWLTKILTPICDAEPATLAKYVVALLKKDKTEEELEAICLKELQIFLQSKTTEFVTQVFSALKTESYLSESKDLKPQLPDGQITRVTRENSIQLGMKLATPVVSQLPQSKNKRKNSLLDEEKPVIAPTKSTSNQFREIGEKREGSRETREIRIEERRESQREIRIEERRDSQREIRIAERRDSQREIRDLRNKLDDNTRDNSSRNYRNFSSREQNNRHNRHLKSKSRSRTRSRSRGRRSPLRRRSLHNRPDRYRSKEDRIHRKTSKSRSRDRYRSRSRTRSRTRVMERAIKSSLSPKARSRSRSKQRIHSKSRSRSRSWSRSRSPIKKIPQSPIVHSPDRARSRSLSSEGRDERDYRITVPLDLVPRGMLGERILPIQQQIPCMPSMAQLQHPPPILPPRPRCRDYDEKGFCIQGSLCQFDHGSDPVIVNEVTLPSVLSFSSSHPTNLPPPPHAPIMHPNVIADPRMQLVQSPIAIPIINAGQSMPVSVPSMSAVPAGAVLSKPPLVPGPSADVQMQYQHQPGVNVQFTRPPPPQPQVPVLTHQVISYDPQVQPPPRSDLPQMPASPPRQVRIVSSAGPISDTRVVRQDINSSIHQAGGLPSNAAFINPEVLQRRCVFDRNRLGNRIVMAPSENNSTLELKNVPLAQNNITDMNRQFNKFGTIVNIQVHYRGEADCALVSFASRTAAEAAYNSSEPVFNNRFIQVLWHTESSDKLVVPEVRKSVKDRLGLAPSSSLTRVRMNENMIQMMTTNENVNHKNESTDSKQRTVVLAAPFNVAKPAVRKVAPAVQRIQKPGQLSFQSAKHSLNQTKEVLKKRFELIKQKQMQMEKNIATQKVLLSQLNDPSLTVKEKSAVIAKINVLVENHEKLKSEFYDCSKTLKQAAASKLTVDHKPVNPLTNRQEMQKTILDAELDLIAKENKGGDTSELDKKVTLMKIEAASLFRNKRGRGGRISRVPTFSMRGRGFMRVSGRGRGIPGSSNSARLIDRRTKQLLVSGFQSGGKDKVIAHLEKYGHIERVVEQQLGNGDQFGGSALLLSFSSRHEAERAAAAGTNFENQKLVMSWNTSSLGNHNPSLDSHQPAPKLVPSLVNQNNEVATMDDKEEESDTEIELIVEDDDDEDDDVEDDDDALDGSSLIVPGDEVDEDVLLGRAEDEDDDAIERSWRR